jgi:ubiquinone/menaquinone biosynthesis C-methylase UbiE
MFVPESDYLSRTSEAYDILAAAYAERFSDELAAKPLERAVLAVFAELVKAARVGAVADIGCGPGRITAYLHNLGLPAFGIDLSQQMVEVAQRTYPHLRFDQGSMTALGIDDGGLGGIVAWYSIIHVPQQQLLDVFAGFYRVLAPGGYLQLAFGVGDGVIHRVKVGDHLVSLDFHQRQPEDVAKLLRQSGLAVRAQVLRAPDDEGEFRESAPQCFILARK